MQEISGRRTLKHPVHDMQGSAFSDKSDNLRKTLAGKNIPDSDLSEKLRIRELPAVKTRPVFTLEQALSLVIFRFNIYF